MRKNCPQRCDLCYGQADLLPLTSDLSCSYSDNNSSTEAVIVTDTVWLTSDLRHCPCHFVSGLDNIVQSQSPWKR